MYRPTIVKENSVSIYFTLIIFVLHSHVDIRGIGPTDLHGRCIALSGKKLVTLLSVEIRGFGRQIRASKNS